MEGRRRPGGSTCLFVEVFADVFFTMVLSQDSQIFRPSPAMDAFTKHSCSTELEQSTKALKICLVIP
jgi:hypothetical protein